MDRPLLPVPAGLLALTVVVALLAVAIEAADVTSRAGGSLGVAGVVSLAVGAVMMAAVVIVIGAVSR